MFLPQKEIVGKSLSATWKKVFVLLSQENIFCHKKQFPVTITNFWSQEKMSSHGKKFSPEIFSCEIKLIFFHVKQYVLPVRGFVPHFAISIHLLFTSSIFPASVFWSLGRLKCITFSRQMCGIHNKNFLWDLKIFWELGSLVPHDSPALACGKIGTTNRNKGIFTESKTHEKSRNKRISRNEYSEQTF